MGNCLDKTLSDDSDENMIENSLESTSSQSNLDRMSQTRDISGANDNETNNDRNSRRNSRNSNRYRRHNSNRYIQINDSNSSSSGRHRHHHHHHHHHNHNHHHHNHRHNEQNLFSQSLNLGFTGSLSSSSYISSSLPVNGISSSGFANLMSNNSSNSSSQVYYLAPNVQRTADQLTEEDQIKLLKRMTLIQQLPSGSYDENKKNKECAICMIDFEVNDTIKYLPCMHTFHQSCIDQWLVRSLICPSCMEPVDAGLLAAYE